MSPKRIELYKRLWPDKPVWVLPLQHLRERMRSYDMEVEWVETNTFEEWNVQVFGGGGWNLREKEEEDDYEEGGYRLYPHPVRRELVVELPKGTVVHDVAIYDRMGCSKSIEGWHAEGGIIVICIEGLEGGVYFLKLKSNRETKVLRFVKC